MSLSVEQLVYTSFPDLGNRVLTSKNLPQAIQQSFMQAVVHPYWQRQSLMEPALAGQSPGGRIIRAAYLHQLLPEQTLFGWLYSDPSVQDSEDCTTHFVCYYLTQKLDGLLLDGIFNCLETGPEIQLEGLEGSEGLESVTLPTSGEYTATRLGVSIPSSVRARSRLLLYKEKLLQFSVPVEVPIEVPQKTQSAGDRPALPQQLPLQSWTELPASPSLPKPDFVQPTQKVALLIGISKSELGFQALPGVEKDIEALEEILVAPNIGAFTTVKTLLNPDSQEMAEEIESFLSTCPADSLALLYFSGHGIWDSQGTLCLTTSASRRGPQQKIVRSTFLSADFLGAVLQDSTVRYPVLMLDCCLSEDSPPNESARKRRLEQVRQQFTESGATVLASSTAIHHTGVQKGHRLSAYTSYLVEGLATGIADLDEDGTISLDEWHTYAMRKAQLASPALRPALYRLPGQPQLAIAKLAEHDPRLQYRREVERCIKNGSISLVNQLILDKSQRNLQLAAADCIKIKAEMLKPHQEYQQKLRQYATVFLNQVQQEGAGYRPVSSQILRLKDTLGLTDADTAPIQAEILQQLTVVQLPLSKVLAPTSGTMPLWNTNRVQSLLRTRPALQTVLAQAAILPLALAGLIAPAERWVGQVSQTIGHTLSRRRPDLLRAVLNLKALNLSALNQWRKSKSTSSIFAGLTPVTVLLGISVVVLLLTAILFDAQQQQRRKRALTQLDTLFQQRDYEKCVADAQQLPRRLGPSPQIQQLLEQCQAGLSWKNTTVSTLPPPSGTIQSMVFGQSGSLLASGGEDPNIQIWDVSAKTLLRTLEGHRDEIRILAASQDGAMLASGSTDKTVRIWQFSTGKLLHTLEGHQGTVQSLSFVPKGQLLASGAEDGTIRLWNTASGKLVRSLKGDKSDKIAIRAIAVSADGKILVSSGAQKAITFWNMEDGKPIRTLKGHTDRIAALVSNGEQFASGSLDKTVKLWRFSDGALLRTISGQDAEPVKSLAFSPSNPILASTSEASVELREADTGKLFHRFSGSSSEVSAMAYSPDGQTLAIARRNKLLNLLRR